MKPRLPPLQALVPWLTLAGLILLVAGARILVIESYGTKIPFWDDWVITLPFLKAYETGQLPLIGWFAGSNEHSIVFTRLIQALCLELNHGQFDPETVMTVGALEAALTAVVLVMGMAAVPGKGRLRLNPWLVLLTAALLAAPFTWFNTIWAPQSQVRLLVLFSVGGMLLMGFARFLSARWWLGALALVAALFTMGSGLFAWAAVIGLGAAHAWRGRAVRPDAVATALVAVVVIAAYLQFNPAFRGGRIEGLEAKSVLDFLEAFGKHLAFPWSIHWQLQPALAWVGMFLWAPPVAVAVLYLARGPLSPGNRRLAEAVILLSGWLIAQYVIVAYTRGTGGRGPAWRHLDVHLIAPLVQAMALWLLWRLRALRLPAWFQFLSQPPFRLALLVAWLLIFSAGFAQLNTLALREGRIRALQQNAHLFHLRNFMETNDPTVFDGLRHMELPFNETGPLVAGLRDSWARNALAPPLRDPLPVRAQDASANKPSIGSWPDLEEDRFLLNGALPEDQPPPPSGLSWRTILPGGPVLAHTHTETGWLRFALPSGTEIQPFAVSFDEDESFFSPKSLPDHLVAQNAPLLHSTTWRALDIGPVELGGILLAEPTGGERKITAFTGPWKVGPLTVALDRFRVETWPWLVSGGALLLLLGLAAQWFEGARKRHNGSESNED